ncbi:unnamed protein product [Ciceribacter selenitireducens ATCC BAA-1503]|uniref:Uncharacterized protein n=1 Tax=Ciceribacter selenitireducens ATCC BAA-1503 TaxID=1336235 RepID=A0A376AB15_9HYPH|nr:unnamed protein product [Ciceribacter selenitireducens ATCC BAA-1503]
MEGRGQHSARDRHVPPRRQSGASSCGQSGRIGGHDGPSERGHF